MDLSIDVLIEVSIDVLIDLSIDVSIDLVKMWHAVCKQKLNLQYAKNTRCCTDSENLSSMHQTSLPCQLCPTM